MRISDWSSDVCSSDLGRIFAVASHANNPSALGPCVIQQSGEASVMLLVDDGRVVSARRTVRVKRRNSLAVGVDELRNVVLMNHRIIRRDADLSAVLKLAVGDAFGGTQIGRAHAELQSLMRISYAVFCLKQ